MGWPMGLRVCSVCGKAYQGRRDAPCPRCASTETLLEEHEAAAEQASSELANTLAPDDEVNELAARFGKTGTSIPDPSPEIECPRCAERIKARAKVCRFCGHELGTAVVTGDQAFPETARRAETFGEAIERALLRASIKVHALRLENRVSPEDVAACVREAADDGVPSWVYKGAARGRHRGGGGGAVIVLVVPDGAELALGIRAVKREKNHPGLAWPELRPWTPDTSSGLERLLSWARPKPEVRAEVTVDEDVWGDIVLGAQARLVYAKGRLRIDRAVAVAWAKSLAR